jgi:hypothetical protein
VRGNASELGVTESAAKPELLSVLLDEVDCVVLLDPEVQLFAGIDDVAELARVHGVALVPSVLEPVPLDGRSPSEPDLQALGMYNVGCLAVGRAARPFLAWHAAHLGEASHEDLPAGVSADQRWVDFVPAYWDHVVVRDPGLGVGSWNLHERKVTESGDGYAVNGSPLRLFNFRGLVGEAPYRFRSGSPARAAVEDQPVVRRLRDAYVGALRG